MINSKEKESLIFNSEDDNFSIWPQHVFTDVRYSYQTTSMNQSTNALSRLPLPGTNKTEEDRNCFGINLLQLDNSPVHSKEVETESRRDYIIASVLESDLTGNWELCENS